MKKLICVLMCAFLFVLSSCVVNVDEDNITGDVKDKSLDLVDEGKEQPKDSSKNDETPDPVPEITSVVAAEASIAKIGAYSYDGGEKYDYAVTFAESIKNADTEKIAEYTMGKAEYYDFLKNVKIASYKIYPFEFSPEKITQFVGKNVYNVYNQKFFVEFEVAESENEAFPQGNCVYYLECNGDEALGHIIEYFVPAEYAIDLYTNPESKQEKGRFIKEMVGNHTLALYFGENNPSAFDFSTEAHLITHLMARSGFYNSEPPYSLNEINEFIADSFDGNEGINFENERDMGYWMFYDAQTSDEPFEEQKLFGCSFAHGGTYTVYTIDKKVTEGNIVDYYVTIYADFAHFAPALKVIYTFEENENEPPKLMLINYTDEFGRDMASFSF